MVLKSTPAFTLIELLIVIAIIILLASINAPRMPMNATRTNFYRAHDTMSDWEKRLEDMKKVTGQYPSARPYPQTRWNGAMQQALSAEFGTLPIDRTPMDPFVPRQPLVYQTDGKRYVITATGPDKFFSLSPRKVLAGELSAESLSDFTYDPTNGTYSFGDVYTTGPAAR